MYLFSYDEVYVGSYGQILHATDHTVYEYIVMMELVEVHDCKVAKKGKKKENSTRPMEKEGSMNLVEYCSNNAVPTKVS